MKRNRVQEVIIPIVVAINVNVAYVNVQVIAALAYLVSITLILQFYQDNIGAIMLRLVSVCMAVTLDYNLGAVRLIVVVVIVVVDVSVVFVVVVVDFRAIMPLTDTVLVAFLYRGFT